MHKNAGKKGPGSVNDAAGREERPETVAGGQRPPWISADLAKLPPATVINIEALAVLLEADVEDIYAAVARQELPPPIPLLKDLVWTAGRLVTWLESRQMALGRAVRRAACGGAETEGRKSK